MASKNEMNAKRGPYLDGRKQQWVRASRPTASYQLSSWQCTLLLLCPSGSSAAGGVCPTDAYNNKKKKEELLVVRGGDQWGNFLGSFSLPVMFARNLVKGTQGSGLGHISFDYCTVRLRLQ